MYQKSLTEFAARRRQRNKIIFSRDMCVRENTAQAASVEFVRLRRTNYARSRLQSFCRKNPEGFSDKLQGTLFAEGALICSILCYRNLSSSRSAFSIFLTFGLR